MKLLLYSGGSFEENRLLNESCVAFLRQRSPKPRLCYIPSSVEGSQEDFEEFVIAFDQLGDFEYVYLPLDLPNAHLLAERALSAADFIFLAGGNTFYFLNCLRESGVMDLLQIKANEGAVIGGLSAGAILLTPDIRTASFPPFDRDENWLGLRDLEALNLVPYAFFPHFERTPRYIRALKRYTKSLKMPTLCFPDGGGIIIDGPRLTCIGDLTIFSEGKSLFIRGLTP